VSRRVTVRRRRGLAALAIMAGALALILAGVTSGLGGTPRAVGQTSSVEVTPQTDAAVPAHEVVMLGASTKEVSGETWGIGKIGAQSQSTWAIVRYTPEAGWTLAPSLLDGAGNPLSGFSPAEGDLAGSLTAYGSGALLGEIAGEENRQLLLVRDRGGAFTETSSPAPLEAGERLFDGTHRRAPMVAAIEEGEEGAGPAGALVVPIVTEPSGEETRVLHWSGTTHAWTSEPIDIPGATEQGFRVLAVAASSPSHAWLLGQLGAHSDSVALFHRVEHEGGATWEPVAVSGEAPGSPLRVPLSEAKSAEYTVAGVGAPPTSDSQLLTVTDRGVWIDGRRTDTEQQITMFFKPEGAEGGSMLASWCAAGTGAPCTKAISGDLPAGSSRSFAWEGEGSSTFGERVITGLPEGASLRLEGEEFKRVLALGASETYDVGASHGAAFSSAKEGWLGSSRLPVHLTVSPEENLLQNYPTPFRHPLLAIAPQPGAPVGAATSEALAVGEEGEVARYKDGIGWQPESLLNAAGQRDAEPQLRAVAWPRPNRAYAVGTKGQMWLWRSETGLWEKDPATPINFRGDLLGIAFEPEEASRGYAVGQAGVLLRYGKSWTQEPTCEAGVPEGVPEPCLPAELADASFTSVAFAGSEAIVAYRVPHFSYTGESSSFSYTGGVLVNNGSGWQIDAGAATALATEAHDIPWAVAGLPDGGAAMSAESGAGVPRIFERNSAGATWETTPQPYPGYSAPGSLAIFREGGALRVIGSGAVPETAHGEEEEPPPAGFPPTLVTPYPLAQPPVYMFRQTGSGWSEEEHDHDEVGPPVGSYKIYDKGYEPDPSWAVLISPGGNEGWAVGGFPRSGSQSGFETADIARYSYPKAESTMPPGVEEAEVPLETGKAVFAIGGGGQCAGPCAARANARIGPDAWLSSALRRAHAISGLRDFLYTGPRVTTGETLVKATVQISYEEEFARYAQLLGGGEGTSVYAAASSADRVEGSECLFESFFPQFFEANGLCASGEGEAYYAVPAAAGPGGPVRALVIDDSGAVGRSQLEWLENELRGAKEAKEAAIVVGNADLNAQEEHREGNAAEVARTIVAGHASAYFFDAPEQNLELKLRGSSIPAFGSGTLGYVNVQSSEYPEFVGASGFLLAQVGAYNSVTESAPVTAEVIPDIGEGEHGEQELALEAKQGTLLHRSQVAMFAGLARRPRAGNEGVGESEIESLSYVFTPIPANCVGAICKSSGGPGLVPEYSFTSSDEEVGRFVEPELHSPEPNAIKFNSKEEPIFEEGRRSPQGLAESKSGLFCALNKGETTVKITAGGVSASLKVKVEAGSVRRPCGTVPVKPKPAAEQQVAAPTPPPPAPAPAPAPASPPPVLPVPPAPVAPAPPPARVPVRIPPPPTFLIQPTLPALLVPFLPPPLVEPANPTPPSGTSAVTSPVEAAQKEEEREEATESVSNQAVAYRQPEHEPSPAYLLGFIVLAAFAGATAFRRPRRGGREVRVAPATISTMRSQQRLEERTRRR
jgi:hypothetical protein